MHSAGADITSAGVIPTPAVAYVTRAMGFDAGLVISASHNPFEDNGIKVFSGRGEKFTETLERAGRSDRRRPELDGAGSADAPVDGPTSSTRTSRTRAWRCRIRAARAASSIAIDTANGATTTVAPRLFRELGFDVHVLERDARRPQHQPRLRIDASGAARHDGPRRGCRMGVAFDGDGDRAIFVDATAASSTATPCC